MWNSVPAKAVPGTAIIRWNGAAVSSCASPPLTSNFTDVTPTLSLATAVAVTVVPGSASDGIISDTTGAVASTTTIWKDCVADAFLLSATTIDTGSGPIWVPVGVHWTRPDALIVMPDGAEPIENVSGSPSASLAVA